MAIKPRQVTPFLVDVMFSDDRISRTIVTYDRAKPVSSNLAHACTAAIDPADAAAKATLSASVVHVYIHLGHKDVTRISVLPFPASANKVDGAQQLVHSTKSAASEILIRCDDRCTEGFRSRDWVPG